MEHQFPQQSENVIAALLKKNSVNCEYISYLAVLELRRPPTGQSFQHGTQRYAPRQQRVHDPLQEVETMQGKG